MPSSIEPEGLRLNPITLRFRSKRVDVAFRAAQMRSHLALHLTIASIVLILVLFEGRRLA